MRMKIGFLITMSSELVMDESTSLTSVDTRARISPFRSSEKKARGSARIFLYMFTRISRTIPVLMGMRHADPAK